MDEKRALFDYVLVITLNPGPDKNSPPEPVIDYRFPPAAIDVLNSKQETSKNAKKLQQAEQTLMQNVLTFCFPDIASKKVRPKRNSRTKTYRFVLTNEDYSKRYGYCVRTLPEEGGMLKTKRYSECFCIISFLPSFSLFEPILELVEAKRQSHSKTQIFMFLKSVLAQPFPPPGGMLEVECISSEGNGMEKHSFVRPPDADNLLAYIPIMPLLRCVSVQHLLKMFASLLKERPIILISSEVDVLSDCVQAAAALVYPFSWQGILVPVMGDKMMMMCASPTPLLVGIMRHHLPLVNDLIDEGYMSPIMILDLDKDKFLMEAKNQDDYGSLPEYPAKKLNAALLDFYKTYKPLFKKDSKQDFPSEHFHIPFVDFQISLFGHYQSGFNKTPGGKKPYAWNQAQFIAATPAAHLEFVKEFSTNTQMFGQFLNEREQHLTKFNGPFDAKVNELGLATVATMEAVVLEDSRKQTPVGLQARLKNDATNKSKNILNLAVADSYTCPKCRKSFTGWRKFCSECGGKMPDEGKTDAVSPSPSPSLSPSPSPSLPPSMSYSSLPTSSSTASLPSSASTASLPCSSSTASLPYSSSTASLPSSSSSASLPTSSSSASLPASSSCASLNSFPSTSFPRRPAPPPTTTTATPLPTLNTSASWIKPTSPATSPAPSPVASSTSTLALANPHVKRKSALESLLEPGMVPCVCGKTNPASVRFCHHCGVKTANQREPSSRDPSPRRSSEAVGADAIACVCGRNLPSHLKFCNHCGAKLAAPSLSTQNSQEAPSTIACACGKVNLGHLKFCVDCGSSLKERASQQSLHRASSTSSQMDLLARESQIERDSVEPTSYAKPQAERKHEPSPEELAQIRDRRWQEASATINSSLPSAVTSVFTAQERALVVNFGPGDRVQERLDLLVQKEMELVEAFQWIMNQRERLEKSNS